MIDHFEIGLTPGVTLKYEYKYGDHAFALCVSIKDRYEQIDLAWGDVEDLTNSLAQTKALLDMLTQRKEEN